MPKVVRHKDQFGQTDVLSGKNNQKYHIVYAVLFSESECSLNRKDS